MDIEFDPNKSERNARERRLPFDWVRELDFETAVIQPDLRFDYPELRFTATGLIGERVHVVCYTPVADGIRVISFRKANSREVERYLRERS
ncbi:MAG: BrnT family toxin [Beijerinckiaceae bacterium]|nr:BrnT family toxin [Beijerinckiaceae bacterium]